MIRHIHLSSLRGPICSISSFHIHFLNKVPQLLSTPVGSEQKAICNASISIPYIPKSLHFIKQDFTVQNLDEMLILTHSQAAQYPHLGRKMIWRADKETTEEPKSEYGRCMIQVDVKIKRLYNKSSLYHQKVMTLML